MSEFKIGDRVEYVRHPGDGYMGAALGDAGVIKAVDDTGKNTWYAVEFDQKREEYGDCNGRCEENKGYWCKAVSLEKYNDDYAAEIVVNQLKAEGYKAADIANAVKKILDEKDDLQVGDFVKIIDVGSIISIDYIKVIQMAAGLGSISNEIIARYAYGYDPLFREKRHLENEKYKILASDNGLFLVKEVNEWSSNGKVLLIYADGVEKWTD